MTDPTRLLFDVNAPDEATALLRSLSAPTPPGPAKEAELAQQLASLAHTPTVVASAGTALWLKAAAAVLALGVVGVWVGVRLRAPEPPPPARLASASVAVSAAPAALGSAPELPQAVASATSGLPETAHDSAVASSSPRAKVAARDSLAEEEALLEQARQLAGPSPSQALALLQQYQRRFPTGQLGAERMFLSVDVLKRLGNTTGARRQADALIRAFPSSVYAAQVKPQSSTPD
jgi:hypothetical protein